MMIKIKVGNVLSTSDDKLVTNKDKNSSAKKRLLVVTSVDSNENLTALKSYTHGGDISKKEIVINATPPFSKKSAFGTHIITHEIITNDNNEKMHVRLNVKNGNLVVTEHMVKKSNIDDAISVLSNREKRKYERHK